MAESSNTLLPSRAQASAAPLARLRKALNQALRGKPAVIEQVLACLLARGHLLLEDLPGLGKTTLAKALGPTWRMIWATDTLGGLQRDSSAW